MNQNLHRAIGVCVCAVLGLLAPMAAADTYYVRVKGNDKNDGRTAASAFGTIGKAASVAGAGDTVYVGSGKYAESVAPANDGKAGAPVAFIADAGGHRTGDAGEVVITLGKGTILNIKGRDFIEFHGFTIAGGSDSVVWNGGVGGELNGCTIRDNTDELIEVQSGGGLTVIGCLLSGAGDDGIVVRSGSLTLLDSEVKNSKDRALAVENKASSLEVRRCTVSVAGTGLHAQHGTVTLINTLIRDTKGVGVQADNAAVLVMVQNTIARTGNSGVRCAGPAKIYNNIFYKIGRHCMERVGRRTPVASHNLMFDRKGSRSHRFNTPEFEFDPEFTNVEANDFSLGDGSGAIDLGLAMDSYTSVDRNGGDRPKASGWDLGAYEGGTPPPVIYVTTDGSDSADGRTPGTSFRTIQRAIRDCTIGGATVFVGPGTYHESLQIGTGTGSDAASGTALMPTRVIADVGGVKTRQKPGSVIVDGRGSRARGVDIRNVSYWSLEGFRIVGFRDYGLYLNGGGVAVLDGVVESGSVAGVYAVGTSEIRVERCTVLRTSRSGHGIYAYANASDAPVVLDSNRLNAPAELFGTSWFAEGPTARRDWGGQRFPIGMFGGTAFTRQRSPVTITNNVVTDFYYGVVGGAYGGSKALIANNTTIGTTIGLYMLAYGGNDHLYNNTVSDSFYGYMIFGSRVRTGGNAESGVRSRYAQFRRGLDEDELVTSAPLFVDPANGDFSLAAGSPLADVGVDAWAPATDIDGRSRPADGDGDGEAQSDIGAVEYVAEGARVEPRVVRWREVSRVEEE